jgi:hypothetical protein
MNNLSAVEATQFPSAPMFAVDPMVRMIEAVAQNPDLPIERLQALMDMKNEQEKKHAEQAFNQSFASAMGEMPDVPKTGHNKHSGQRYSTLDDLIRTARPVLARHGLSLNWTKTHDNGEIFVTAIVRHAQGHSILTTDKGKPDSGKQMNALQGGGSTETYLKRYTGFSILGLSSGDEIEDDGKSAHGTATITAEQFIELRELIDQAGITDEVLCLSAKINTLHELPSDIFDSAAKKLRVTIANKSKQTEDA